MMNMKNMLGMSGRSMSDGRVQMSNGGSLGQFMGMNTAMGSMLAKDILSEKGRTISDRDREIAANIRRTKSSTVPGLTPQARYKAQQMMSMSDNEPRFEERSLEGQIFSIDSAIRNLMTEYDMVVRNIPLAETLAERQMVEMRAQNVVDQIDQLQKQKIDLQSQNTPIPTMLEDIEMMNVRDLMGESGRTISNRDRQIISDLLETISD